MENRNGLVVDAETTRVSGHAERMAAIEMLKGIITESGIKRVTVSADKGFDTRNFVDEMRELGAIPHVAQNTNGRRSAIDRCTTAAHPALPACRPVRPTGPELARTAGTAVWWVGDAETPEAACLLADAETDARGWDHERFEECADLDSTKSRYLVYRAPADFGVGDGKDTSRIAEEARRRLPGGLPLSARR